MEFGSVKFFRRVIALAVLICIIGLTVGVGITTYQLSKTKKQMSAAEQAFSEQMYYATAGAASQSDPMEYQASYWWLYAALADEYITEEKVVYLTFNGGPSERTGEILDILAENDVKGTFFTIGETDGQAEALTKRIVDEGHTLGINCYSDSPADIYKSVETYLQDFEKQYTNLYRMTKVKADVFRFPEGTINKYNIAIRSQLTAEMLRRGFTYYDWNASGGDEAVGATAESIVQNSIETGAEKPRIMLLLHDDADKQLTVEALPQIIEHYKQQGYTFEKITNQTKPMMFN